MACPNCTRDIWLRRTEKGKVKRLKQIIENRVIANKQSQTLSQSLRVPYDSIPAEADVAVRELIEEGIIEETEPNPCGE